MALGHLIAAVEGHMPALKRRRIRREVAVWERAGRPAPAPASVKHKVLKNYADRYHVECLVETGTYLGDTVQAMRGVVPRIISIELSEELHARAQRRFEGCDAVTLLQGDSAQVLPEVVAQLDETVLFWLDGHYSEGITARGSLDTPIMAELEAILGHHIRTHVVLIDDARCYGAEPGWPSIPELQALIYDRRPDLHIEVDDDIMRIAGQATPLPVDVT